MAAENRLWGAPRIHGELLKLGIAVSERTVSRYLADIRRAPSQTWRTFLANHFGQLAYTSPAILWDASDEDDGVDVCGVLPRRASASGERSCVSDQWSDVHWPLSFQPHAGCRADRPGSRSSPEMGTPQLRQGPAEGAGIRFHQNASRRHSPGVSITLSVTVTVQGHCLARTLDASGTSLPSLRPIMPSTSSDGCNVLRFEDRKAHVCVSF